jgi:hypothetical protein
MIPDFDDRGYLPVGVHPASLDEIETRFGRRSELRQVQMQSLRWLVELAKKAGVQRLVINGSFATDIAEPNDVDCVLLMDANFPRDPAAEDEIRSGLPFLQIDLVRRRAFDFMVSHVFATDREWLPKGMVEVIL